MSTDAPTPGVVTYSRVSTPQQLPAPKSGPAGNASPRRTPRRPHTTAGRRLRRRLVRLLAILRDAQEIAQALLDTPRSTYDRALYMYDPEDHDFFRRDLEGAIYNLARAEDSVRSDVDLEISRQAEWLAERYRHLTERNRA